LSRPKINTLNIMAFVAATAGDIKIISSDDCVPIVRRFDSPRVQ